MVPRLLGFVPTAVPMIVTLLGGLDLLFGTRRAPLLAGMVVAAIVCTHVLFWGCVVYAGAAAATSMTGDFGSLVFFSSVPALVYGIIATFSTKDSRMAAIKSVIIAPIALVILPSLGSI
ncbi:unnamed protein product [Pedinophyceae sp. YPF-701]|nr:unnamed protein product [Pedinophyceae sp. YPF-701]